MSLKKIGVLISGGGSNLQSLIDKIHGIDGDIRLVISNNKEAYGLKRAEVAGIGAVYLNPQRYSSSEDYNKKIITLLRDEGIELVVLAGYMKIITKNFVNAFPNAIVNIHPALIPSFCGEGFYGCHVHEAVYAYGVKVTGATVHFVNEQADNGPIIAQETVRIHDDDTPESIQKKVLMIEHQLLPAVVKLICENKIEVKGRLVKQRSS